MLGFGNMIATCVFHMVVTTIVITVVVFSHGDHRHPCDHHSRTLYDDHRHRGTKFHADHLRPTLCIHIPLLISTTAARPRLMTITHPYDRHLTCFTTSQTCEPLCRDPAAYARLFAGGELCIMMMILRDVAASQDLTWYKFKFTTHLVKMGFSKRKHPRSSKGIVILTDGA